MPQMSIDAVADSADMIVNGYAFSHDVRGYRVLNLNAPHNAAVITPEGSVLETSMNDIELGIMLDYYRANRRFLEDNDA